MVDIALSSACASALRADEPPSATGSCSTKVAPSINRAASPPTPEYFRAIVDDYAREQRAGAKAEMQFYMRQPSLTEAVDVAAKCVLPNGKRHPHQRRIPSTSLVKVRRRLLAVDFRTCKSFDDLHAAVNDAIADIHMIGALFVYDVSQRIGAFLRLAPERVYLHRGTLEGALALGLGRGREWIDLAELPEAFRRLTPAEAEDCLCIYKRQLGAR